MTRSRDTANIIPTVDAKGDLLVGTANNTIDNLSPGTNGQVLTANSATGTGLEWGNTILPGSSSDTGLSIKALISQTGNLQEWQSSNGAPLASVTADGAFNIREVFEKARVVASAWTGTVTYDVATFGSVYYTTSNASANWTPNIIYKTGVTLNSVMTTETAITVSLAITQGATAFFPTAFQIDGTARTVRWINGSAPTFGNPNSIDIYTYTIIKTENNVFTVLASRTRFA
jgi:hypothetical protein